MTTEQQAIYLNAIPLVALGLTYLGAGASLIPALVRSRSHMRELEPALALVFPCGGLAALLVGVVTLRDREPVGGNAWVALVAIALAFVPALAFFVRFRDRTLLLTAPVRARAAEERARLRDAESLEEAARALVDRATAAARVEFGALLLVEGDGETARGLVAVDRGREHDWFPSVTLDLRNEPSGVTSAYHEAAPLTVYDARASQRVNASLVERTGARSLAFIPLIEEQRVIAVLVIASLSRQRVFGQEEIAELQTLAAEAAPVVDRLRETPANDRDAILARLAAQVRSAPEIGGVLRDAVEDVARVLNADRAFVRLGEPDSEMSVRAEWRAEGLDPIGDRLNRLPVSNLAVRRCRTVAIADIATAAELEDVALGGRETLLELGSRSALAVPLVALDRVIGAFGVHRKVPRPWAHEDVTFVENVAKELALGLHASELTADIKERLDRQTALLHAAQALAGELALDRVYERLVEQVVQLVGADAASFSLLDAARDTLRVQAVHGLAPSEVGRERLADEARGEAIATRRPVVKREFSPPEIPRPAAPDAFAEAMHAPVVVDEVRGVLDVFTRIAGRFDERDVELLEAFATLASLALRNAEAFEERSRQLRIQRGFYRIASVLADPLSISATYDAVAHAAGEAFGAAGVAVVMPQPGLLRLAGAHGLPQPLFDALEAGFESDDTLALAAAERRIIAAPALGSDTRFSQAWRELTTACGLPSLLVVPLQAGDEASGLVLVLFYAERRLRDEDVELARHLAGAGRAALERSGLFEAERTSRALAQQLARSGGVLATELDPAAVLDEVVDRAPALLGADACAVRIVEDEELIVTAVSAPDVERALGSRVPIVGGLSAQVIESRRPVTVEDASTDPALAAVDPMIEQGYRTYLGVPLVGPEGALHGVLSLYGVRPRAWREEEVEALLALAANTAAALSNAELYQRVALEKERSAAILENIADGIVALDRDGNVVLWNQAAEEATGVPASEALGRSTGQILGRTLSGESVVSIRRGDGDIWLSITEAVMTDPAGQVSGRIYALRDISAERVVEEMKSEFVSTVSHELRGPLTSIYGFAETMLRQDVLFGEDERRVFLGYIASESERLTVIVDALLSVARLDTGDLQVNVAPTDVRAVVADVVSSAENAASNGHSFVLELPQEPLSAAADADKLRQVLAHLVDNAVKYSPGGGRVTIAAHRHDDTVEVHVVDQGVGIPPIERERIFRKFYRVDQERGGTGLGLFLAQGLVNAMGGRIWVEPAEGRGSRFAFALPAARV